MTTLLLHPLRNGDTDTVLAVFDGLGERSRWQRFHAPAPRLTRAAVDALAAVDGRRHVAYVASVDGRAVGIGRYFVTAPGRAEVAVAVVDAWQRRGVGTALLRELCAHARENGVSTFEASVQGTNVAVRRLLAAELDDPTWTTDGSVLEVSGRVRRTPAPAFA